MARVPIITSPCPLRWKSMPSAGRDFCGQCHRHVHNLDGMSDAERQALLGSCSDEVCVAYTVSRQVGFFGAVGLGIASAIAGIAPAAAQDSVPTVVTGPTCDPKSEHLDNVMVGGVKAGKDVKWVNQHEAALPDAPRIEEIDASDWLPPPKDSQK